MIDLYLIPTANGQKAAIMLEECGLSYATHLVDMADGEHLRPPFVHLNPAGKIPVIVDPDGPGGEPFILAQSMAIVLYLAEKTGKFLPEALCERAEAYRYMALVSAEIAGAFTGLFVFSNIYKQPTDEVLAHYREQAARNLRVLDRRLGESPFLAGDTYSVADILAYPVAASSVKNLPEGLSPYPNLRRWSAEIAERPAVRRGMQAASA